MVEWLGRDRLLAVAWRLVSSLLFSKMLVSLIMLLLEMLVLLILMLFLIVFLLLEKVLFLEGEVSVSVLSGEVLRVILIMIVVEVLVFL